MKRWVLITAGLAVFAGTALAGTPAPAAASAAAPVVSKKMHDDVIALLQATLAPRLGEVTKGMSAIYITTLQSKYRAITPDIADEIREDIGKVVTDPERVKVLEESLVPIYAKLYTDDEVRQIIAFSKTPAGTKLFSGTPNQEQINEALQPWAQGTVGPAITADTAEILKKHGIDVTADSSGSDGPGN
jgi:hypothetical protein